MRPFEISSATHGEKMFNRFSVVLLAISLITSPVFAQDDKQTESVYSGPQVGEVLPGFKMKLGLGDNAGTEFDIVKEAGEHVAVIVFVHKKTRPAFGLANAVMRYCSQDGGENLHRCMCFLTSDPTEAASWMSRTARYFPKETPVGYSTEGVEGPGAYGLNRNVELTVLVSKANKVTANFALVQPGAHADGPKILAAIAAATGANDKPDINKYLPSNQAAQDAPIAIDPGLMKQIRRINAKNASEAAIGESIVEIEKMIDNNKPLQNQLGSILTRWVNTKRVDSIGNTEQQAQLKKWARNFAPKMNRAKRMARPASDSKLTELLRSVIQKSNSDDQVDAAAKRVEQYVAENPAASKELARIVNTVVNSDRLSNYGTAHAQEILKSWAKKYSKDK